MLRLLTTARDTSEASLITGRLEESGIRCLQREGGPRYCGVGRRDILVDERDLDRACEVLDEDRGGFDEDELARLSEEAVQHAREHAPQATRQDIGDRSSGSVPAQGGRRRLRLLTRILGRQQVDKAPGGPFGR